MSLLPDGACFEELVQDCFLAFRGAGVMLSPLDAELVSEWAALDVPYEVVARGIRKAAERALWDARPGDPGVHTLRSCRREVKAEIRKYLDRAAGKGDPEGAEEAAEPIELARHKRLRRSLKKLAKDAPGLAPAVARLLEGPLADAPTDLSAAARCEEWAVAALARALPFPERLGLQREVRARTSDSPSLTARARRISRRFHREALLRMKLELSPFW